MASSMGPDESAMPEILFQLNRDEGTSLQAQIRETLVSAILSRRLLPGEAVPSSRMMAKQLGVSRNTIVIAYQALVDDGYLDARDRSGYFVGKDAPVATVNLDAAIAAGEADIGWLERMTSRPTEMAIVDRPRNWREYPYSFLYGQIDQNLFSHTEWRDCARQTLGSRNFEMMAGDSGPFDDPLLVDYICQRVLPRRGVLARPENVVVTLGAQNALYLVAQLLVKRGSKVVMEDPGYPDLRNILNHRQAQILAMPVDDGGLPVGNYLADTDMVFVTPSHQAPTTMTMPMDRRAALLKSAHENDFVIIEDDYEFEMSFLKSSTPSLKSLDKNGRVLYVGSFSKSLFPGLRLGYLVGPEIFIREARALRHQMLRSPPGLAQRTAAYFLALGHHDAQIRRMRKSFAARREVMQRAMTRFGLVNSQAAQFGGTSFWVKGPAWLDANELAENLRAEGVLIEAGAVFFAAKDAPKNYFRLAYSSIDSSRIDAGVEKIARAIAAMNSG